MRVRTLLSLSISCAWVHAIGVIAMGKANIGLEITAVLSIIQVVVLSTAWGIFALALIVTAARIAIQWHHRIALIAISIACMLRMVIWWMTRWIDCDPLYRFGFPAISLAMAGGAVCIYRWTWIQLASTRSGAVSTMLLGFVGCQILLLLTCDFMGFLALSEVRRLVPSIGIKISTWVGLASPVIQVVLLTVLATAWAWACRNSQRRRNCPYCAYPIMLRMCPECGAVPPNDWL